MDHTQRGGPRPGQTSPDRLIHGFLLRAGQAGVLTTLILVTSACASLDSLGVSGPDRDSDNNEEQSSQPADQPQLDTEEPAFFPRRETEPPEIPGQLPSPELPAPEASTSRLADRPAPDRSEASDALPVPSISEDMRYVEASPTRSRPPEPEFPDATDKPEATEITSSPETLPPQRPTSSSDRLRNPETLPTPPPQHAYGSTDSLTGYHGREPAVGSMSSVPLISPSYNSTSDDAQSSGSTTLSFDGLAELGESEDDGLPSENGASVAQGQADSEQEEITEDDVEEVETDTDTSEEDPTETEDDSRSAENGSNTHPINQLAQSNEEPDTTENNDASGGSEESEDRARSQPAAETTEEQVDAAVGQEITIAIDGRGWIFAGEQDGSSDLELKNRSVENETTEFTFEVGEEGNYVAEFVLQDLSEGTSRRHIAEIRTEDGEEDPFDRPSVPERFPSPAAARRENGEQPVIVNPDELLDSEEIPDDSRQERDEDPAPDLSGYGAEELRSMLEQAVNEEDSRMAGAVVQELYAQEYEVNSSETLLQAADLLERSEQEEDALTAYELWLAHFDGEPESDTVHFTIANLYEERGTTADMRRSSQHYQHVADQYPRSDHAREADRRARRLLRHFVDVR